MGNSQNPDNSSKYGQIYMNYDNKNYFQGEVIQGSIFVNITEPYPGKVLSLLIEGHEFCQWARHARHSHKAKGLLEKKKRCGPKGSRDIYSHKVCIFSFGGLKIPVGQWTFPFCFELDKDMPASFRFCTPKIDSYIVYKMTAVVESAEQKTVKNMEYSQEFNIFQIRDENYAPLSKNASLESTLFFFFSRGNTQMNAFLNKNNYVIGEEVIVTIEIDNQHCKSAVSHVDLELIRKLELKSRCGREKNKIFQLLTRRHELAIPENHKSLVSTKFSFKLGNEKRQKIKNLNMIPNTSIGKLVKNHYFLRLKLNYSGFFGTKSHKMVLPIMVYEKGYDEKFNPIAIEPPVNWNPQIMPVRNVSIIDAQFVAGPPKNENIAGYEYPVLDQGELWNDEKFQEKFN